VRFRVKIKFGTDRVKVYFVNKANGKKEILQIKTNRKFTQIGVYYGILEDNAPLIAKFYLKDKDRDLLVTKEYNYIYEVAAGVDISFMAMLAIFLNRYRIYLAEKTTIYTSKEVDPYHRSTSSSDSVRSRNSNKSSKSSKLSLKDVKISNISTHTSSDIDSCYSFPRDADNKSSPSLHSKRISSIEI